MPNESSSAIEIHSDRKHESRLTRESEGDSLLLPNSSVKNIAIVNAFLN